MDDLRRPQPPHPARRQWRSLEERHAPRAATDEFAPGALEAPDGHGRASLSRRDFLGLVGAAAALATATACDRKGREGVVPYTRRPFERVPGQADFYASAFTEGGRAQSVLVKTREGRPIHLNGNDEHPRQRGGASPRALADLMRLYDPDRLREPRFQGRPCSWEEAGAQLRQSLAACRAQGLKALVLGGALGGPTRRALLKEVQARCPELEYLAWEPGRDEAAREACRAAYGRPLDLRPRLDRARVILCLGADPLDGTDPGALRAYAEGRRDGEGAPREPLSRLWSVEGALSLTGAKADRRLILKPSLMPRFAFALAQELQARHRLAPPPGCRLPQAALPPGLDPRAFRQLARDLAEAGPEALVLCGEGLPREAQLGAHLLNAMLGSRALEAWPQEALAGQEDLERARREMAAGRVGLVLLWGPNPAYAHPRPEAWRGALLKVPARVWLGLTEDESAADCPLQLPESHWLEAWGDHDDPEGILLQQPAIAPLYDTRQGEEVLMALAGLPGEYRAFLRGHWERVHHAGAAPFEPFFEAALHDGLLRRPTAPERPAFQTRALEGLRLEPALPDGAGTLELQLQPCRRVFDGRYANNAWLQELPDPVTKCTWGNPLSLSVAEARTLGLKDGDRVRLELPGAAPLETPVLVQPGQAPGLLVLALGYGRSRGRVAAGVGLDAWPLTAAGPAPWLRSGARISRIPGHVDLPITQGHHRMEGRDLVRCLTVAELRRQAHGEAHGEAHEGRAHGEPPSLYPPSGPREHRWGMAIDLAACVGCGACVLACQAENNVPVVGAEQVARGREMHWIRIDRYYEGDPSDPSVVQQPMLCQHCDHAPCENVCPVNATTHSADGLNQMTYNRCVGTRYCANNCPYKVRRFNFLEYTAHKKEPESLVHNPEVTVRPRGVMEKCTFCVQRIQDARMRAKGEGRGLRDGEVQPACAAACPAQAIVFGDLDDPDSRVSRLARSARGYRVLEELGARPAITYLADLRNPGGSHES